MINTSRQIGATMGAALLPRGRRGGRPRGTGRAVLVGPGSLPAEAVAAALAVALGGVKRIRPRLR